MLKDIRPRDIVKIKVGERSYEGIVMPRTQYEDPNNITIKLSNGYNVGIAPGRISDIIILKKGNPDRGEENSGSAVQGTSADILILSTGGTIASKVDYRTGAVKPALSSLEVLDLFPELKSAASISVKVIMNVLSENIKPEDWTKMAKAINEAFLNGYRAIVIAHGTDTMHYTAAALSFALDNPPGPVVLVGSQRSSDRPSSDAGSNLIGAVKFASTSNAHGVFIAMHAGLSDDLIAIHSGVRVRKNHTSQRSAFQSINSRPVALVDNSKIGDKPVQANSGEFKIWPLFDERVALVKFYPGLKRSYFDHLFSIGTKAIILEGSGLGHVSKDLIPCIREGVNKGVFFGMTSQCIWGSVNMNIYETGRDLLAAGVIPLGDMLSEVALVKAMWSLGNGLELHTYMPRNLRGEISERREVSNA